jgi:hypothetical protein
MIWVTLLMLTNFLQLLMLMKKQTNINVEEPVQKVAMTKAYYCHRLYYSVYLF